MKNSRRSRILHQHNCSQGTHQQSRVQHSNDQRMHKGGNQTLPFKNIPWRVKIEFMYFVVLWLNAFPVQTEVLAIHSPHELLVRWSLDYKKHCRVIPGRCCKVHNESLPSDRMTAQMHEAIAVGPTGNLQEVLNSSA